MLPHSAINQTPYYSLTGNHPHVEWLRIFGCRYYARKKGDRPHKLDYNTSTGVFLGFTGTAKNVYYYDIDTKHIKTSTHGIFDEANITVPKAERSNASQALIDLGYRQDDDNTAAGQESHSPPIAQIQLLSPASKIPTQGSVLAAGYDVYSTTHCIIQPQTVAKLPLGIAIAPPKGSYVQLHSRSGLASKGIVVYAGVIDPDYRGDIAVLLYNSASTAYTVNPGDRIAQLTFHNISSPVFLQKTKLDITEWADQGFGSTDITDITEQADQGFGSTDITNQMAVPQISQAMTPTPHLQPVDMPYNIFLSQDPFDDVITIAVKDFGAHVTMGMVLYQRNQRNRPRIIDIQPSQPCSRTKKWRSTIKNGYLTQIEEFTITNIADVEAAIQECRTKKLEYINLEVALDIKPTGIHPTEGIPQLFSDQLVVIQQHLQTIRDHHISETQLDHQPQIHSLSTRDEDADMGPTGSPTQNPKDNHNPTKDPTNIKDDTHTNFLAAQHPVLRTLLDINYEVYTDSDPKPTAYPDQQPPEPIRFKWKQIKDDPEWLLSCYQQLDQYEDQDIFDKPQPKPNDANAWPLVWTFLLKPDRKKARCTVDGSKLWRRNMQLGQTYVNSLATDSERLFWAIAAKRA